MTDYLDLQNGFYNAFTQGMGMSQKTPFQIIQPTPPLLDNTRLFQYLNSIPPYSLTQNYISSSANRWLDNYAGLMSALKKTCDVNLREDLGTDCYTDWMNYITKMTPVPSPNELPQLFFNWAMIWYPDKANIGLNDYSQILLDPIASAQASVVLYKEPSGFKPADFVPDYKSLTSELSKAPNRSFAVSEGQWNSNVSKTWTSGGDSGFFGLWGGSSSTSTISTKFASSGVSISCSFEHATQFAAAPGNWYNSSAFGLAYHNKTGNPWNPKSSINWDNTFGSNGNLQRFATSLVIGCGMTCTVTSTARYSESEQTDIKNNSHAGLWPFYSSGSSSEVHTSAEFNQFGNMTVSIKSDLTTPLVLGCIVLGIGELVSGTKEVALKLVKAYQ